LDRNDPVFITRTIEGTPFASAPNVVGVTERDLVCCSNLATMNFGNGLQIRRQQVAGYVLARKANIRQETNVCKLG